MADIAAHLRVAEGGSPLLFERLQQREKQRLLYAWLAQEGARLEAALPASERRLDPQTARRSRIGSR